jgi:hypothetical protein
VSCDLVVVSIKKPKKLAKRSSKEEGKNLVIKLLPNIFLDGSTEIKKACALFRF